MRTPLEQALHDAQFVSEWMDDNHDDSVGFATAWAEIQSIIRYLSAAQQGAQRICFTCGGPLNASSGYLICERGCGGPVTNR